MGNSVRLVLGLATAAMSASLAISFDGEGEPPRLEENGLRMTCADFPKRIVMYEAGQDPSVRVTLTATGQPSEAEKAYCAGLVDEMLSESYWGRVRSEYLLAKKVFSPESQLWLDWAKQKLRDCQDLERRERADRRTPSPSALARAVEARMRLEGLVNEIKSMPEMKADNWLVELKDEFLYFQIQSWSTNRKFWLDCCTSFGNLEARQSGGRMMAYEHRLRPGDSIVKEVQVRSSLKPGRYRARCVLCVAESSNYGRAWNLTGKWEEFEVVYECPPMFAPVQKALPPGWVVILGTDWHGPPKGWEEGNLYIPKITPIPLTEEERARIACRAYAVYLDSWYEDACDPHWWPGFREYLSLTWTPADYNGQRLATAKIADCEELIGANAAGKWFGWVSGITERAVLRYAQEHFGKDGETVKDK